jgi:glycosyltransferase involved in cell wall biosynthesis
MKIAFSPFKSQENKYVDIMVSIINSIKEVKLIPFKPKEYLLFSKKIWGADTIWLNWYENDTVAAKKILKIMVLFLIRFSGKKIIYVLHNKKPHDAHKSIFTNLLCGSMYYFSNIIIVHSEMSRQVVPKEYAHKIRYIPHPNYINEYGEMKYYDNADAKLRLLFLGQIRPYKNMELLIKAVSNFDDNELELTIVGKPISQEYMRKLQTLIRKKNIKFISKFVEDNELTSYLGTCDLLVLPYDITSSLNSGTVILAFSYAKTVICPNIGTLSDMENKKFLSYTYVNQEEHDRKLTMLIQKSINLKMKNKNIFNEWGKVMYNEVAENNSKEKIRELIEEQIIR